MMIYAVFQDGQEDAQGYFISESNAQLLVDHLEKEQAAQLLLDQLENELMDDVSSYRRLWIEEIEVHVVFDPTQW